MPTLGMVVCLSLAGFTSAAADARRAIQPDQASELLGTAGPIRKLVAQRTFSDGTRRFYLLVWDGGNFVVKSAPERQLLESRTVTPGVKVAGRFGNTIWVYTFDEGYIHIAELSRSNRLEGAVLREQQLALTLAEGVAKMGTSLINLGVEIPVVLEVKRAGAGFSFERESGPCSGAIQLEPLADGTARFCVVWTNQVATNVIERLMTKGLLDARLALPRWYELYYLTNQGLAGELVSRTEVLAVELANGPLRPELFQAQYNIQSGIYGISEQTKEGVKFKSITDNDWRKVFVFGHTVSLRVFRFIFLALGAAGLLITAALLVKKSKKQKGQ